MIDPPSSPDSQRPTPVAARPVPPVLPYAYAPPLRPVSPLTLPGVDRRNAAIDLLLVAIVAILIPFGFEVVAWFLIEGELEFVAGPIFAIKKWFDFALAAGLFFYLILRHRIAPASFGLRKDGWFHQLAWAFGALGGVYASMAVSSFFVLAALLLAPELQNDLMERTKVLSVMPVGDFWLTLLLLVPVALHEEIIFRGLLLPYLRRTTGRWWLAVVLSSAIFAVLHLPQGVLAAFQIFGVSAVLSLFFIWSRSLLAVALAHFLFDFLQFQLIRLLPDLQNLLEQLQPK